LENIKADERIILGWIAKILNKMAWIGCICRRVRRINTMYPAREISSESWKILVCEETLLLIDT
jgi:hypothetical protein